jgi:hypothetical protein
VIQVVFVNLASNLGDWLLRGLAVLGAAALGGFLAGLIVQISARMTTTKKAPPAIVRLMRVLGAITLGLLAAFALFHAGGPGGGGSGQGGGKDSGKGPYTGNLAKDAAPKEQTKSLVTANPATSLRIIVLGAGSADGRHYRVDDENQPLTLDQLRSRLTRRLADQPPLEKLVIVLYENSPDQDTQVVRNLKSLALDHHLTPEISEPQGKIPSVSP